MALYGAASPPNVVAEPDPGAEDIRSDAHLLRVVAWPPAADRRALVDALVKMLPQHQWRNPVMFVVYVGSILTTLLYAQALFGHSSLVAPFLIAAFLPIAYALRTD